MEVGSPVGTAGCGTQRPGGVRAAPATGVVLLWLQTAREVVCQGPVGWPGAVPERGCSRSKPSRVPETEFQISRRFVLRCTLVIRPSELPVNVAAVSTDWT